MAGVADMGTAGGEDPVMEIASAVMSGVEATLEDFTAALEEKLGKLADKIESMQKAVDALQETRDTRSNDDKDKEASLNSELDADLIPSDVAIPAPMPIDMQPKTASKKTKPANLYSFICKKG
jgi:hypothetical protein